MADAESTDALHFGDLNTSNSRFCVQAVPTGRLDNRPVATTKRRIAQTAS